VPDLIEAYFDAGAPDKAVEMTMALCGYYYDQLDYFLKQTTYIILSAEYEIQSAIQNTMKAANACEANGKKELADEITSKLEDYYGRYLQVQAPASKK
jgi:hypothetical protein